MISARSLAVSIGLLALIVPMLVHSAPSNASNAGSCQMEARNWSEIEMLIATPIAPEPEQTDTLPWGEQVAADDLIAIRGTVEQFIACSNDGEPLRVLALYTDDYVQRLLARERPLIDRERYDGLATPMPVQADSGAVLTGVSGARRIVATGQLGALVTITYPSVPEPKTFFFTFRWIGNSLLIDDILGEITFSVP